MNKWVQDDYPKKVQQYPGDRHSEAGRKTIESSKSHGRKPPTFPGVAGNPQVGQSADYEEYPGTSILKKEGGTKSGTKVKGEAQPIASFKRKAKFSR